MSIGKMRSSQRFMRTVASLVLFVHTSVLLAPSVQAAEVLATQPQRTAEPKRADDDEGDAHAQALEALQRQLLAVEAKGHAKGAQLDDLRAARSALRDLRTTLKARDNAALSGFDSVAAHIRAHHLPDVIVRRHQEAVEKFRAAAAASQADLAAIDGASNVTAVERAAEKLKERIGNLPGQRRHQAVDPARLPFRAPPKKFTTPRVTKEQFAQTLPDDSQRPLRLASLGMISLAAAGALSPSDPVYRAPTEDVQITQPIKDLAQQLHNNPVEIYNWVHDNIIYLPTYGSVQGSDLTLQTKRGNAFDTASLLVALLRAAGVPARYVYGTVEIPIDKIKNWVGGVRDSQAALDLLAQGGVPVLGLAQGGRIVSARMEHVWVEAYVDFVPSRGTKNLAPDTWVPMDASFKQYTYTAGVNFATEVPVGFDPMASLLTGAAVDTSVGSIADLSQPKLLADVEDYQALVAQYVTALGPNVTPERVLGGQTVVASAAPGLAASLPYRVTIAASRTAALSSPVRHYVQLALFNSKFDEANDSPVLTRTIPLAELGSKRLGVTYRAATASDQAVLDSYAQAGAKELPAYLIRVVPALQIDGVDVAVGPAVGMGEDQFWQVTVVGPGNAGNDPHTYARIAGDEIVFGLDRNGVTQTLIADRLNHPAPNAAAEHLHQIGLLYWAETDLATGLASKALGYVHQRLPSAGVFASPMTVQYSYGVPRIGFYQSRQVDIARLFLAAVGVDGRSAVGFHFVAGTQASLLEGRVLDQVAGAGQGSAASAIQLLLDAGRQGIPIYTITESNASAALPRLDIDSAILADISAAVGAGKTVIVSERAPAGEGWSGTGYVILDPETGSGAYLIKGGLNGGEIPDCERQRSPIAQAIQQTVISLAVIMLLFGALVASGIITGGTGGAGAPVGATIIVLAVGVAATVWPSPASAAGKCNDDCHRGRVQAQGGGVEKSVNWALPAPPTLAMGLEFLARLQAQLTPRQLADRAEGFAQAADFMQRAAAGGGICAADFGYSKSFPRGATIRVDIEIRQGKAFVP